MPSNRTQPSATGKRLLLVVGVLVVLVGVVLIVVLRANRSDSAGPTESEVRTGLVGLLSDSNKTDKRGLTSAQIAKVADCAAPQLVKQLSDVSLRELADRQDPTASKDASTATGIISSCAASASAG